jgi:hypothetical protein
MDRIPVKQIIKIPAVGDCFFQATAAGVDITQGNKGSYEAHAQLRNQIADELRLHPQRYATEDRRILDQHRTSYLATLTENERNNLPEDYARTPEHFLRYSRTPTMWATDAHFQAFQNIYPTTILTIWTPIHKPLCLSEITLGSMWQGCPNQGTVWEVRKGTGKPRREGKTVPFFAPETFKHIHLRHVPANGIRFPSLGPGANFIKENECKHFETFTEAPAQEHRYTSRGMQALLGVVPSRTTDAAPD